MYNTQIEPASEAAINYSTIKSLNEEGHPSDNHLLVQVINPGPYRIGVKEPPYMNYFNGEGKVLLCINNSAVRDQFFGRPERIYWPDLMAVGCSRAMTVSGGSINGLEGIWRISIDTQTLTARMIEVICGESCEPVDIGKDQDVFYAFLASDHGKGPARMLAKYPEMFGRRFIDRLKVFPRKGRMPDICWVQKRLSRVVSS